MNQLVLFGALPAPESVAKVFGQNPITSKGVVVGASIGMLKRKELAEAFNLKGKDNKEALDAKLLEGSDEAFRLVKGQIAQLGGNWTLRRMAQRTVKDEQQITIVMREVKRRKNGPTDEQIAQTLGMTVDQVKEMRERQEAALRQPTIELGAHPELEDAGDAANAQ